jgi:serine/threonine protein kinase
MADQCPQCGGSLPAGGLAGLCPSCLLKQGAAADTATRAEAKPFVPPAVEEVAQLFPQLEVLGFLGKGGMGAVYKARQPALDRLVALKILPARAAPDPGFAERFSREARALARLSHPNIVAVFEFGQVSADLPYFIMEFVDGVNLRQLQKAGRLSPREALQIVPQICDALQYAHDEGVVHRDIKPENILVDRKGRVKIADFGLAKIMKGGDASPGSPGDEERTAGATVPTHLTEVGQVMGTPHYMAPEQVEHPLAVDHRADIFSLGVVFYEMLTGELPLGKFQPPSAKVRMDVRLDEVVLHALEKEPERRYQQASQVKTDVQRITAEGQVPGQVVAPPTEAVRRKPVNCVPALSLCCLTTALFIACDLANVAGHQDILKALLPWSILSWIVGGVFWSILHYSCWKVLPEKYRATTPGRALGFIFVPLFNFYWAFITFPKLATGFNALKRDHPELRIRNLRAVGIAYAISTVLLLTVGVAAPPGAGSLLFVQDLVLTLVFYLGIAANANLLVAASAVPGGAVKVPVTTQAGPSRPGGRAWKIAAPVIVAVVVLNCILVALCLSAPRGIAPPPGLVGWWRGEGNGNDSAGTNNGVLQEGVAFVTGKVGQAFSFDGTTGYVEVPDVPSLRLTNELTIEFWVRRQDLQVGDALIEKGADWTRGVQNYGVTIAGAQSGNALVFLFAGGTRYSTSIADLNWHHIAVVARNGDADPTFYVDAVPQPVTFRQGPEKLVLYPSTAPLHIGAQVDPVSGWFYHSKALLDEVSIYNRALPASEIQAIFAAGQHGKRGPNRGLLGALLRNNWFPGNSRTGIGRVTALPKGWSPTPAPGQKPDPNKVRDEANELRAKGEYQAALDRYLWYWNHALEYEPGLSAVRLSFLLSDWVELGRRYPKAKQALLDTRARDTQLLLAGGGDFDVFMELSNINRSLQDEDATYEAFNKLRQRNPTLAWQCFLVAERLLVKHGDYALCLEYVGDPEAAFDRICQRWQLLKQHEQPAEENPVQVASPVAPLRPSTPPKTANRHFVDETCQLILILVKTDHKTEAGHIRERALALVNDPQLKSVVTDAERGPVRQ